jgi:hypothetical protein
VSAACFFTLRAAPGLRAAPVLRAGMWIWWERGEWARGAGTEFLQRDV